MPPATPSKRLAAPLPLTATASPTPSYVHCAVTVVAAPVLSVATARGIARWYVSVHCTLRSVVTSWVLKASKIGEFARLRRGHQSQ